MAKNHNEYLAIHVLNEQQLVSYRTLSRALKVHSNLAKQMLYEFHRKQNAKKSGSVHATYLITGTRQVDPTPHTNGVHKQDGEDTVMQSSPYAPSSSAQQPDETMDGPTTIRSVMLVKEEDLEKAKALFEPGPSIHIYSLEANGLSDVQTLTECNRQIAAEYASEDPLQTWKQYGTIHNPNARRRSTRNAPPPASIAKTTDAKTKASATTAKAKEAEVKAKSTESAPEPLKKDMSKPEKPQRQNSDIFKSFAKGKVKAKEESQTSADASPAAQPEDLPTGGFSDDEDASDDVVDESKEQVTAPAGKSKEERRAELQAMMDQEDEPMGDAPTPAEEPEEPSAPIDKADTEKEDEPMETATLENGRRRGKRRIMKKKTVKDEDGYLVTKEDWAWESFSENEPAPKKMKAAAAKKGAKPGQGNIMSFFGKK